MLLKLLKVYWAGLLFNPRQPNLLLFYFWQHKLFREALGVDILQCL